MGLIKYPTKETLLLAKSIAKHTEGNYKDFIGIAQEVLKSKGGPFGYDVELSFVIKDSNARSLIIIENGLL